MKIISASCFLLVMFLFTLSAQAEGNPFSQLDFDGDIDTNVQSRSTTSKAARNVQKPTGRHTPKRKHNTRLRVLGKPIGEFGKKRSWVAELTLFDVKVSIRNVGDTDAENVQAVVNVPSVGRHALKGPRTLPRNTTAQYRAWIDRVVTSKKEMHVDVSCSNCYR